MLGTFAALKSSFKLKPQAYTIDNWVFQAHYRWTTLIYFAATIMVTSRQYIGEHIKCISDSGVADHVMNTFCFFTSTFTVIEYHDKDLVKKEQIAHPGVGPYGFNSTAPIIRHAYYQWVPFVLFGQGLMFYITHLLWKKLEGGRMSRLLDGMQYSAYAVLEKEIEVKGNKIPSKEKKEEYLNLVRKAFLDRIVFNKSWSRWLIFCEFLNMLNVILQIYISNEFLGRQFYSLGSDVIEQGLEDTSTVLDEVFPKVTKCTFHKYGPSGSIQLHDAMCVMALNIMNEKIFVFLWFWLLVLFFFSCLGIFWRISTILLHARSNRFNRLIFSSSCPGKLNPWTLLTVTQYCDFTDWLFLSYLSKNLDGLVFRELFLGLAEELEEKKPLLDNDEEMGKSEKPTKID